MNPLPQLVLAYETLSPESLPGLLALYSETARFKDPFNDVEGHDAIAQVFRHMFRTLDEPHFVVDGVFRHEYQGVLVWTFRFHFKGETEGRSIHGTSVIDWDAAGKVTRHRDHWDPAEQLYEKLPVLGGLMRWLKRRVVA